MYFMVSSFVGSSCLDEGGGRFSTPPASRPSEVYATVRRSEWRIALEY
jgi:hypothetical protein